MSKTPGIVLLRPTPPPHVEDVSDERKAANRILLDEMIDGLYRACGITRTKP